MFYNAFAGILRAIGDTFAPLNVFNSIMWIKYIFRLIFYIKIKYGSWGSWV